MYQRLEHIADTGFYVTAPSLERLYVNAALSLTDHFVPVGKLTSALSKKVSVEAENRERLLVNWLNEILFLFEKEKFLAGRIVCDFFDGKSLKATLWGESYDKIRHGKVSEIKAVTYHQLEIGSTPDNQFFARIFLDL